MDMNAQFCRILLAQARKDLTGREAEHFDANAAVMKMSGFRGFWLFEWSGADLNNPGRTFTLELQADNAAHARALGIVKWLEVYGVQARDEGNWPPREFPQRK